MLEKIVLVCGILSSLLYVAMNVFNAICQHLTDCSVACCVEAPRGMPNRFSSG
jgi:hypothetical protein